MASHLVNNPYMKIITRTGPGIKNKQGMFQMFPKEGKGFVFLFPKKQ
jgi:hypothetical protein